MAAANLDSRVKHIRTQPFVMDVRTGLCAPNRDELSDLLRLQGYNPKDAVLWFVDALIEMFDRIEPTLIEVKPHHEVRKQKTATKLEERRAACRKAGYGYATVTDEFFDAVFGRNVRILRRYQDHFVDEETRVALIQAARDAVAILTIGQLGSAAQASVADVYSLIAEGTLQTPLRDVLLNSNAYVTAGDGQRPCFIPLDE